MKAKKITLWILMFLPLVVTLIVLPVLPEQIPAHYDVNNEVTRWGSKYETLILPAVTVFMGLFMLVMSKISAKQENHGKNNENICIIAGIISLIIFNIMTVYFLLRCF